MKQADAVLRVDRRLEGSGSPCCFWVRFPDPTPTPPGTDGRLALLAFSKLVVQKFT